MKPSRRNSFTREIVVILTIKFILLSGLWFAFFRHPIAHHLTDAGVSRAIVGDGPHAGARP